MFVPTVIGADETQEIKGARGVAQTKEVPAVLWSYSNASRRNFPVLRAGTLVRTTGSRFQLDTDVEFVWHFKGKPGDKELHVVMNFQFDDPARNGEMLETMLSAIEHRPLDLPEDSFRRIRGQRIYATLR